MIEKLSIMGLRTSIHWRKMVEFIHFLQGCQNMHYGLNRLKKSKMDKIELKSNKITKIGRNRVKSRYQNRLYDFNIIVALKVPPQYNCWLAALKVPPFPQYPPVFLFT